MHWMANLCFVEELLCEDVCHERCVGCECVVWLFSVVCVVLCFVRVVCDVYMYVCLYVCMCMFCHVRDALEMMIVDVVHVAGCDSHNVNMI